MKPIIIAAVVAFTFPAYAGGKRASSHRIMIPFPRALPQEEAERRHKTIAPAVAPLSRFDEAFAATATGWNRFDDTFAAARGW